ncbi:MAG: DUF1598 domain-containing protein [Planctomycetes bacterium]|nr:DUF1598 domain-containing protein [Planctomycetota bacterium]
MFRGRMQVLSWVAMASMVLTGHRAVLAQGGGGGGGGGVGGGGQQLAGVAIDAGGVLSIQLVRDPTGELSRTRMREATSKLAPELARPSTLRKVSLNRLEGTLAARLASGQDATEDMRYLAGLTRITHVFYYPETRDIVIAGPAEGFFLDLTGRPIGLHSGRAVMELDDLIVALRAFSPDGIRTPLIGVSIDPTQEGLQRLNQFLSEVGNRVSRGNAARIAAGVKQALGHQNVSVTGISTKTHFAQVLVEADYRMKLISVALERPPVEIGSYVDRANPRAVSRNALARFYFTPNYECVRATEDGLAMQLTGDGVKLVTEQELVTGTGERVDSAGENRAAEGFAVAFTEKYPELAQRSPVYAQMRNLIDLSIAAAFIQQQDYYAQSGWELGVFANESAYPIETHESPRTVESAVNAMWKGNVFMTPIGGGVNIQPRQAIQADRIIPDRDGSLKEQREQIGAPKLGDGQWWWD